MMDVFCKCVLSGKHAGVDRADKPAIAHLRRFNIINKCAHIIVIMYF